VPNRPKSRSKARPAPKKSAAAKKTRVALLGFGTVGRSVAKILCQDPTSPFILTHIFNRNISRKKTDGLPRQIIWTEDIGEVLASDAEIIVELVGGIDPAGDWIRKALRSGKSVVTANKLLIADHGPELLELAQKMGHQLEFGASVAGGIPAIIAIQQGLSGDRLFRIAGILNGTCNYILTRMESTGASFETALKEAQQLGYAEADPTSDVDGYDARAKLVILIQAGLRLKAHSEEIPCLSISSIEAVDFAYAGELNCSIRQISIAQKEGQKDTKNSPRLLAAVRPTLVPRASLLAHVQKNQNMVIASGEFVGQIVLSGYGAGGDPTAVAVVSDLYSIARSGNVPATSTEEAAENPRSVSGDFTVPHYVRFVVKDRPGIVAEVATIFARHGISIDALLQRPGFPHTALPFIVTVEPCSSALLDRALAEIAELDFHVQTPLCLPLLPE
jgi:homoserine dehydrogenase